MAEWTLRLVIPREEDGGAFPVDIILDEDDEGRDDMECETRRYVPDRTTTAVCVSNGATGHCECELCGKPIDPWDGYCRHCGARVTEVER